MVLADRGRGFVQEVVAGIGDAGVNFLDFGFCFFPVIAEFLLGAMRADIGELGLLGFKTIEWRDVAAIARSGKTGYAQVDTNSRSCGGHGLFNFPLGLDLTNHLPFLLKP